MLMINRIEAALQAMGQAEFQKLCEAYLHRTRGGEPIPIGSVVGASKTRTGRPDILLAMPDGKFILAECTSQQDNIAGKLRKDLESCFDTEATGVERSEVQEIVLCFNSDIGTTERKRLTERAQQGGYLLSFLGMGKLSHDLYQHHPQLLKHYLGIGIDTGQILEPQDFVAQYGKNALATPLSARFLFRENELAATLADLKRTDLVLITGRPGVGKTHYALHCCEKYREQHPDTVIRCILSKDRDLLEDIRNNFNTPGEYLVLVDDANRVSRFADFVDELQREQAGRSLKIITTVRSYAVDAILADLGRFGEYVQLELEPFTSSQIREFVQQEFGIGNHRYYERITDLSKGNPRLVAMIAIVAKRENTLDSIYDVSSLYDNYFEPIRREINASALSSITSAVAVVAFLQWVDLSNDETARLIENHFGIDPPTFRQAVDELHRLEVVDRYENGAVTMSDQVLATYFFYLAFFRDRTLNVAPLLGELLLPVKNRVADSVYGCVDAFDVKQIIEVLRPPFDEAATSRDSQGRRDELLQLFEVFWFVHPARVLLYLRKKIEALDPEEEVNLDELSFEPKGNPERNPVVSILCRFRNGAEDDCNIALQLILDYVAKRFKDVPIVLRALIKDFGFSVRSITFRVERSVVEALVARSEGGKNQLFSRIFLSVAEQFLKTEHSNNWAESRRLIRTARFRPGLTEEIRSLRDSIWGHLFILYERYSEHVLALLRSVNGAGYLVSGKEILEADASRVLPFMADILDADSYEHCLIVQDYLSKLRRDEVAYDPEIESRFKNATYHLADLLDPDLEPGLDHEQYAAQQQERIDASFASYGRADYAALFLQCQKIANGSRLRGSWDRQQNFARVFSRLARRDSALFEQVLVDYLASGNPLNLERAGLPRLLIDCSDAEHCWEVFSSRQCPGKDGFLFNYFWSLTYEEVSSTHAGRLLDLYRTCDARDFPYGVDYLENFLGVSPRIFCEVSEIVLGRTQEARKNRRPLIALFSQHTSARLLEFFSGDLELLKRVYFAANEAESHVDYTGEGFGALLDADASFGAEYVRWVFSRKEYPGQSDDRRQYAFLWHRDDWETVVTSIVREVYSLECMHSSYSLVKVFFELKNGDDIRARRQRRFIPREIEKQHDDIAYMQFLFYLVATCPQGQFRELLALFLEHNSDFEHFRQLPLEIRTEDGYSSRVEPQQEQIDHYESLLPLLRAPVLLEHRAEVERRLEVYRRRREEARAMELFDELG